MTHLASFQRVASSLGTSTPGRPSPLCPSLRQLHHRSPKARHESRANASGQSKGGGSAGGLEVPDVSYGFVAANQAAFRGLPLWTGIGGIVALLANRVLSGIAPVVDASSSQSRTDVLGIVMSAVLILTGLQWLSLKAKALVAVPLEGTFLNYTNPALKLPAGMADELQWVWQSLQSATRSTSLVLLYQDQVVFWSGLIQPGVQPSAAKAGDICRNAMKSGQGNYLANLVLYPGRKEFTSFLPDNSQGVVVQPVGSQGVLIVGTDTVRGFSRLDQAWIAALADKLEAYLEQVKLPTTGVGFKASSKASSSS